MAKPALFCVPALLLVAVVGGQQPVIQNANVSTRPASQLSRDIDTMAAAATTPVWVAWQVPMADGDRSLCCTYVSDDVPQGVRGCRMEPTTGDGAWTPPQFPVPSGPVQLEAGTSLTMYVRLVERRLERVRVLSDDCPVDGGGRDVRWLTGVSGADSVAFLQSLATRESLDVDVRSGITSAAVRAIGYHRDPAAVSALIAIASVPPTSNFVTGIRRQAMTALGQSRDPRALAYLSSIITR